MIEIKLTKGHVAIVDDCDADLSSLKWCVGNNYAVRTGINARGNKSNIGMHRVILERKLGRPISSGMSCDHINNNKLDNRRDNLREATRSQNQQNKPAPKSESGYRGVAGGGYQWMASINVNGKIVHLGTFQTPELAYQAYCEASKKYRGEFARFD